MAIFVDTGGPLEDNAIRSTKEIVMRTDYESSQYVEITAGDGYQETEFVIGLMCTANSCPGSFNPYDGGYPPEGPEFELSSITVAVMRVNRKEGENEFESPLDLSYSQFVALVGADIADDLIEKAHEDARDEGNF
jgi:hypothetical protein